jgi:hypothetical protein
VGVDVWAGKTASFSEVRGSKGMDGSRDGDIFFLENLSSLHEDFEGSIQLEDEMLARNSE